MEFLATADANTNANENGQTKPVESITFLSYNVGLLRLKMLGMTLFSNPPYAKERLPFIPEGIKSVHADIVAIQECYEDKHAEYLIAALKEMYPYHARMNSGGVFRFHNGLMLFSKFPIKNCTLQAYKKVSSLEYYMATKSSLIVDVDIPGLGVVTLVNMHTTAGGHIDPEHPDADSDREDELRQAYDVCAAVEAEGRLAIILGDLNCGPEASAGNFKYILDKGFRDTYIEGQQRGKLLDGPEFTWDPKNFLNTLGPHKDCPGQRCDHVLLPINGMENWNVDKIHVIFSESIAPIGNSKSSTLSDHHGLIVQITK